MKNKIIKLGVPKGSLQESTLRIFKRAGFNIKIPERSYVLKMDDPEIECFMLRPQEIPRYIEEGKLDVGISGEDWIRESRAKVVEISDLKYAKQKIKKTKWVLAVSKDSKINSVKGLGGKTISTEIVNLAKDYLKKNKVKATVEFSWGATEVKPPRFADAVIDLVETGVSLEAHNLKILDTVFESSTMLIANFKAMEDSWKREKIKSLNILLEGAVEGERMTGLTLDVRRAILKKVLKVLPAMLKPTVTKMPNTDFYNVFTSASKVEIRKLVPKLKKLGCEGIVEYPLRKVIP
jgi:ATP phosphoribosyltransferase